MFNILEVIEIDDGTGARFEITFAKDEFERFKKAAKRRYKRKKYTDVLGNKFMNNILLKGLDELAKQQSGLL